MPSTRKKGLVATVAALALLQIAFEDVVVFLGATGSLQGGPLNSPHVLVAVPLVISVLLLVVLVGGAIRHAETLR